MFNICKKIFLCFLSCIALMGAADCNNEREKATIENNSNNIEKNPKTEHVTDKLVDCNALAEKDRQAAQNIAKDTNHFDDTSGYVRLASYLFSLTDMPSYNLLKPWLEALENKTLEKKYEEMPGLQDIVRKQDKETAQAVYCLLNELVKNPPTKKDEEFLKKNTKPCAEIVNFESQSFFNCREEYMKVFLALKKITK